RAERCLTFNRHRTAILTEELQCPSVSSACPSSAARFSLLPSLSVCFSLSFSEEPSSLSASARTSGERGPQVPRLSPLPALPRRQFLPLLPFQRAARAPLPRRSSWRRTSFLRGSRACRTIFSPSALINGL